jgi:hypothetical protein
MTSSIPLDNMTDEQVSMVKQAIQNKTVQVTGLFDGDIISVGLSPSGGGGRERRAVDNTTIHVSIVLNETVTLNQTEYEEMLALIKDSFQTIPVSDLVLRAVASTADAVAAESKAPESDDSTASMGSIVGGVLAALVLVGMVVVCFVKKCKKTGSARIVPMPTVALASMPTPQSLPDALPTAPPDTINSGLVSLQPLQPPQPLQNVILPSEFGTTNAVRPSRVVHECSRCDQVIAPAQDRDTFADGTLCHANPQDCPHFVDSAASLVMMQQPPRAEAWFAEGGHNTSQQVDRKRTSTAVKVLTLPSSTDLKVNRSVGPTPTVNAAATRSTTAQFPIASAMRQPRAPKNVVNNRRLSSDGFEVASM